MAIKNIQIIPKGDGSYSDILHPETNAGQVKFADGTTVEAHKADTTNPHSVTKAQVGLGNVLNYGIATQAEAEAGTANNKYMTPLRVQQAIAKALAEFDPSTMQIYTLGIENLAIVNGYSTQSGTGCVASRSKQANHLLLTASSQGGTDGVAETSYVTDTPIDFTQFQFLCVDMAVSGSLGSSGSYVARAHVVVSPSKTATYTTNTVIHTQSTEMSRNIIAIPVDGVTGGAYVRVHTRVVGDVDVTSARNCTFQVYQIYLVK